MTKLQSSLPHKAGRAFTAIRQMFDEFYDLTEGEASQLQQLVGRFTPNCVRVRGSYGERTLRVRLARACMYLAQCLAGDDWPDDGSLPPSLLPGPQRYFGAGRPHDGVVLPERSPIRVSDQPRR